MKYKIFYLLILFSASIFVSSCVEEDLIEYNTETNVQRNDPFKQLLLNTPVVSFVAGEAGYGIEFLVITPDNDETKTVDAMISFTDSETGSTSDEVALKTYNVDAGQNTTLIQDQLTYEDLSAGLTINGGPLPADPVLIPVGSKWTIRLLPKNADGSEAFGSKSISVAVLSPFAGLYTVIESAYYRIGSGPTTWDGEERFIGSVDANTFSYNDYWGNFSNAGSSWVFDLNPDNTITVLDDPVNLVFSGSYFLSCQEDAGVFTNVPCTGSNVLIPDPGGKHIIKLTYGYFTITGDENEGAREFYEVLEKIVE